jgi:hypothetical protein
MKHILSIFLLVILPLWIFAQETPIFNIGAGMPIFFKQNYAPTGYGTNTATWERINLFAEKPILISKSRNLTFNPGISYFLFNETFGSDPSALGGSNSSELNHMALSISTKLLHDIDFKKEKNVDWYFGFVTGKYIITKTKGTKNWTSLQEQGYTPGAKELNKNGKSFFHSFYGGIIAGFKGKSKSKVLKPQFEFSFYPSFVSMDMKENISVGMVAIILGI